MHGAVGTPWSVAGEQKDPRALALDKGRVYWVDHAAGTVNRASKSGGVVTLLATGQKGPVHISLDATDVFWANAGDGTIRRTEKLPVD
jgi:hypothetical protein